MEKETLGQDLKEFLETRGYLTVNQLVKYLAENFPTKKVSYPTLQRYVAKGYFKGSKVGGQFRLSKASIEKFLRFGTDPEAMTEEEGALEPSLSYKPEPTEPPKPMERQIPEDIGEITNQRNLDEAIPITFGDDDD